jgi:hypothetical protein
MARALQPHWFLQERAQRVVERLAPDMPISAAIIYKDEEIEWDKECNFGRVSWTCKFIIPLGHPARALLPKLNRAIALLRARYDLGVLCG